MHPWKTKYGRRGGIHSVCKICDRRPEWKNVLCWIVSLYKKQRSVDWQLHICNQMFLKGNWSFPISFSSYNHFNSAKVHIWMAFWAMWCKRKGRRADRSLAGIDLIWEIISNLKSITRPDFNLKNCTIFIMKSKIPYFISFASV